VTLIECVAGRLPLVATRVGGLPDVSLDGIGLLTPSATPKQFGGTIAALTADIPPAPPAAGLQACEHVGAVCAASRLISDLDWLFH
jgi:hypothetical protein